MTSYSQEKYGEPVSVGIASSADTLEDLPYDPPTDGTGVTTRTVTARSTRCTNVLGDMTGTTATNPS